MTDRGLVSGIRARGLSVALGIAVLVILADQASKAFITGELGPGSGRGVIEIIPGVLRFLYVENRGAAFGMLQGAGSILTVLAVCVVLVLAIAFRHLATQSLWLSIALGLQFGGALGNIIDRLRHSYVVDFINVPHFPTFNVADSAITIGVVVLGIYLLFRPIPESTDEPRDRQSMPLTAGDDTGAETSGGSPS